MTALATPTLTHLDLLEAEAIHIIREAVAQCARPALLFSGGKDSAVVLRLALKAFAPSPLPFPLLHIDTGHNYEEVLAFRDRRAEEAGARLVVGHVEDAIRDGRIVLRDALEPRNRHQSVALLDAVRAHGFDALFGGARRDEEKARAKERIFSFRDESGRWDPRGQRPE
ncbi:MAG TPA: sulfate adenylyltransferase subunit CysD, partial [Holophagaceae bacterium]|nr:sulfate adenylyltransferase subunit CysD [Holophagaceae bacterium]